MEGVELEAVEGGFTRFTLHFSILSKLSKQLNIKMDATLLVCILTLDSLEDEMVAVRSIMYPNIDTLYEYYNTIVGVEDVTIEAIPVPASFHAELIGLIGDPTLTYPAYDIALDKKEVASYKSLILKTIDHEKKRLELGVKNSLQTTLSIEDIQLPGYKQRKFDSLHRVTSVLEKVLTKGKEPDIVGWVLSPKHNDTQFTHGVKLLTDPDIGKKWDSLIGTAEFPDFTISRRITSASWTFQHPSTTKMLASIMEWWAAAHMRSKENWIHSSEKDLDELLNVLRGKGVPNVYHSEKMDTVRLAILDIEETVMGNTEIYSPASLFQFSKPELWRLWIDRCLRSRGVMLDSNVEYIQQIIYRWIRDGWGIRKEFLPYPSAIPRLREAWNSLVRTRSVDEKCILVWIRLLNINDPVYMVGVDHEDKQQILDDWIPVAVSYIKSANPSFRASTNPTYRWLRTWLLKYIPEDLFTKFMLPKRLQYSIITAGYPVIHSSVGYYFVGLELPIESAEVSTWIGEEVD